MEMSTFWVLSAVISLFAWYVRNQFDGIVLNPKDFILFIAVNKLIY